MASAVDALLCEQLHGVTEDQLGGPEEIRGALKKLTLLNAPWGPGSVSP
jgi:hypothetical protein